MKVSYTNHIGQSSRDKHSGKNTAISSLADLSATERHNNHEYEPGDVARMQSAINLDLRGLNLQYEMRDGKFVEVDRLDLERNVRDIYNREFDTAVKEYNVYQVKAGHPERQIQSYIDKISRDKQHEVAVEGLIQFGSFADWQEMSIEDRKAMAPLLLQCLQETTNTLKTEHGKFVIAGASIHLNEGTPHLHYVGVPVQHAKAKTGMAKRVKKTAVFTNETLAALQDSVRTKIEPAVQERFGWTFEEKKSGRNSDLEKNVLVNEKLKAAKAHLLEIDVAIHEKTDNLERSIREWAEKITDEVTNDTEGIYEDAKFFIQNCSDEEFNRISDRGYEMKKEMMGPIIEEAGKEMAEDLDQLIKKIKHPDNRPQLSRTETNHLWNEVYKPISNDFWRMQKEMKSEYNRELDKTYKQRRDALKSYYKALYFLRRSHDLISTIIGMIWLLRKQKLQEELSEKIKDLKAKRNIVMYNTSNFAQFSRAYREELKSGQFPCHDYLESMERAFRFLDREYRLFQRDFFEGEKQKNVPEIPAR